MDWAPNVFYSLESQTRPMYWHVRARTTIVHEIAHMWFGDSVSLELWPDIWLNEGFATWSEWIYSEKNGGKTAAAFFDERYANPGGLGRRRGPLVPRSERAARAGG